MSKEIKVKELIGPEIKVKDKAVMRTKPVMNMAAKGIKTGTKTVGTSMLGAAIDAADPKAKETAKKHKEELAAAKELKREMGALNVKSRPLKQKIRMGMEKRIFKKTAEKELKTRTAFSLLLYRRQAYQTRYQEVLQQRRREHVRRFTLPARKALAKSNAAKAAKKAKDMAQNKVAKVAEKQTVKQTVQMIRRLAAATKAIVAAIVTTGGVAVAIPLLVIIILFSVFPAFQASPDAAGNGIFASPFGKAGYTITSEFGPRIDPITGRVTYHDGYDVCADTGEGSPVYAVYDGTVIQVHNGKHETTGYGSYVILRVEAEEIEGELTVLYGHLSGYVVKSGDKVETGQLIGFEGNTGKSTGAHLHFEVRLDGEAIDGKIYWDL